MTGETFSIATAIIKELRKMKTYDIMAKDLEMNNLSQLHNYRRTRNDIPSKISNLFIELYPEIVPYIQLIETGEMIEEDPLPSREKVFELLEKVIKLTEEVAELRVENMVLKNKLQNLVNQ